MRIFSSRDRGIVLLLLLLAAFALAAVFVTDNVSLQRTEQEAIERSNHVKAHLPARQSVR